MPEVRHDEVKEPMLPQLRRRLAETRMRVVSQPWTMVAFAGLAGVWFASHTRRRGDHPPGALAVAVGAIALRFVREAALLEMGKIAKTWLTEPPPPSPYAH